jgi:type II restriction enzyme
MTGALAADYHSGAQRARVVTEAWARSQLYCANCNSSSLGETPANNRAIDFVCPRCRAPFQLKAKHSALGETVTDGAYTAMVAAIREDRTPNLLLMRYALATWEVRDLLLIPSFMFSESAVIKRKPLTATARRAGWVGCNIALNRVPAEARIQIVKTVFQGGTDILSMNSKHRPEACATVITPPEEVRAKYKRVKPLKDISVTQRGWTLDVLNAIRRLGKTEFTTADAYAFTRDLEKLHPDNSDESRAGRHVRDNPVKDFVSRGRNPPATPSPSRRRLAAAHRPRHLASAVNWPVLPRTSSGCVPRSRCRSG